MHTDPRWLPVRSSRSPRALSVPRPPSGWSSVLRPCSVQMERTLLYTHPAPRPPCCATCGENPHTVRPCQVQQLEKGLPGRLKVVAKSTEGTETMEGVYNTVSVCRASRGWMDTPVNWRR